jgi:hypothetical protein
LPSHVELRTNVLRALPMKFTHGMSYRLAMPITIKQFQIITNAMAKGKSSCSNEIIGEFYTYF